MRSATLLALMALSACRTSSTGISSIHLAVLGGPSPRVVADWVSNEAPLRRMTVLQPTDNTWTPQLQMVIDERFYGEMRWIQGGRVPAVVFAARTDTVNDYALDLDQQTVLQPRRSVPPMFLGMLRIEMEGEGLTARNEAGSIVWQVPFPGRQGCGPWVPLAVCTNSGRDRIAVEQTSDPNCMPVERRVSIFSADGALVVHRPIAEPIPTFARSPGCAVADDAQTLHFATTLRSVPNGVLRDTVLVQTDRSGTSIPLTLPGSITLTAVPAGQSWALLVQRDECDRTCFEREVQLRVLDRMLQTQRVDSLTIDTATAALASTTDGALLAYAPSYGGVFDTVHVWQLGPDGSVRARNTMQLVDLWSQRQ